MIVTRHQSTERNTPVNTELDLELATAIVSLAVTKSRELGVKMNVAVVDAGGNLVVFARMDGAWLGSVDIAIRKAKTAVMFDAPTAALGALSQPGGSLYGIEHTNGGLVTFGGGLEIRDEDGTLLGAIGVSGSTVENDVAVATYALSRLN
jgi:uncharacterized protein GlcG (DUF336 family)